MNVFSELNLFFQRTKKQINTHKSRLGFLWFNSGLNLKCKFNLKKSLPLSSDSSLLSSANTLLSL